MILLNGPHPPVSAACNSFEARRGERWEWGKKNRAKILLQKSCSLALYPGNCALSLKGSYTWVLLDTFSGLNVILLSDPGDMQG